MLRKSPTLHLHCKRESGFALISVISLVVLLALVAVALLTLSSINTRTASIDDSEAKENAKLALMEALDELQKTAGPDQRSTATGDLILGGSTSNGKENWVGVWDTTNYNPSTPNTKPFIKWLVSSSNKASKTSNNPALVTITNPHTIFNGNGNSNNVQVDLISVNDSDGSKTGNYAYWVADEGVKADISWNTYTGGTASEQATIQLAATPGADASAFGSSASPFSNGLDPSFYNNLEKTLSPDSLALANGQTGNFSAWLETYKHDLTTHSKGVLADMKLGGLKRDLSLAFEMDGATENSAAPGLFNAQNGEFVNGADRLQARAMPNSTNARNGGITNYPTTALERFLYRDHNGAGSRFSNDITTTNAPPHYAAVRGPNWWSLRDYYNLYKQLRGSTLTARPSFPCNTTDVGGMRNSLTSLTRWGYQGAAYSGATGNQGGLGWHSEMTVLEDYIYKPVEPAYAPVTLGATYIYSLKENSSGNLALMIDPIIYFWNPYNITLSIDQGDTIQADIFRGVPGSLKLEVSGTQNITVEGSISNIMRSKYSSRSIVDFTSLSFSYNNGLTMTPGEVIVMSGKSQVALPTNSSHINKELELGYLHNDDSGIEVATFTDTSSLKQQIIAIKNGDEYSVSFSKDTYGQDRNYYLAISINEEETQSISSLFSTGRSQQMAPSNANYIYLENYIDDSSRTIYPEDLSGKVFFGAMSYVAKPAIDFIANIEVFAQSNPNHIYSGEALFNTLSNPGYSLRYDNQSVSYEQIYTNLGFDYPIGNNAYYGNSYDATGSTAFIMKHIPESPMMSLAQFSNANLSTLATEPYSAVGNSFMPIVGSATSPIFSFTNNWNGGGVTAADHSWLLNDALFDRYFFSGIAPESTGSIATTLTKFANGTAYTSPVVNPNLKMHIPEGKTQTDLTTDLNDTTAGEGYLKTGAYALMDGQFNVNSTSIVAWEAFIRSNKGANVTSASDTGTGTPFPSEVNTVSPIGAGGDWGGVARLTDTQINTLATNIVAEVRARGPFMSLSDFVNRRLTNDQYGYIGALQKAIDASNLNTTSGTTVTYTLSPYSEISTTNLPQNGRTSATGIAQDITQAKLLIPLAPKMNARSDTFTIRAYGETVDSAGNVKSSATCEALVQRLPEYFDTSDQPWDENYINPLPYTNNGIGSNLSALNQTFGRKFKIISIKWL